MDSRNISRSAVRRSISDALGPTPARLGSFLIVRKGGLNGFGSVSISLDDAVKRCATMLVYLATLRIGGIEFGQIPQLAGAQVLRDVADTLPNEVPAETKRPTFRSYAS